MRDWEDLATTETRFARIVRENDNSEFEVENGDYIHSNNFSYDGYRRSPQKEHYDFKRNYGIYRKPY